MKRIAIALVLGCVTLAVAACTATSPSHVRKKPASTVRTVKYEGSDVQVSWNPATKTSATLTYSDKLSIWSNDAEQLIAEATGCKADAWVMHYPQADEGFQAVSMPIQCE